MASPASAGVCTGRRRARVSCSKLYPRAKSLGSLNAGPRNDSVTGSPSAVKPAGTIRSGKPVRLARLTAVAALPPGAFGGSVRSGARRGNVVYTMASSFCALILRCAQRSGLRNVRVVPTPPSRYGSASPRNVRQAKDGDVGDRPWPGDGRLRIPLRRRTPNHQQSPGARSSLCVGVKYSKPKLLFERVEVAVSV